MGLRENNTQAFEPVLLNAVTSGATGKTVDFKGHWIVDGKELLMAGPLYRYHYGFSATVSGPAVAGATGTFVLTVYTDDDPEFGTKKILFQKKFEAKELVGVKDMEILRFEIPQTAKRYVRADIETSGAVNYESATKLSAEYLPLA